MKSRRGECVKVLAGMDAQPGAFETKGTAMPFTADFADILCGRCMMENCGMVEGAQFNMKLINTERFYRVVITTKLMETEIEFDKLLGVSRRWRQGVEVGIAELN